MPNQHEILPGLWVGNIEASQDSNFLKKNNIKAILNCTIHAPNKFSTNKYEYMRIPVEDSLQKEDIELMKEYLPIGVAFIRKHLHLQNNNILVHCMAGKERSCSIVVGYLLKYFKKENKPLSIKKAYEFIIKKRPPAFFGGQSYNFHDSLIHYKKTIKN